VGQSHRYFRFPVVHLDKCPLHPATNRPCSFAWGEMLHILPPGSVSPAARDPRLRTPPAVPAGRLQTNAAPAVPPRIPVPTASLVPPLKDVRPAIVPMPAAPALQGRMGADVASRSAAPEAAARTGQLANSAMGISAHATPEMPPAVKSVSPTISAIHPADGPGSLLPTVCRWGRRYSCRLGEPALTLFPKGMAPRSVPALPAPRTSPPP